jgi:hypothetical protein
MPISTHQLRYRWIFKVFGAAVDNTIYHGVLTIDETGGIDNASWRYTMVSPLLMKLVALTTQESI